MSYRKLDIDGNEWRFKVGRSFLDIRSPDGRSFKPTVAKVKGVEPEAIERGRRWGTSYGMITPSDVVNWIKWNTRR